MLAEHRGDCGTGVRDEFSGVEGVVEDIVVGNHQNHMWAQLPPTTMAMLPWPDQHVLECVRQRARHEHRMAI